MADTETILADDRLKRADPPKPVQAAKALALEAIDEAFQERVKFIFEVLDTGWASGVISANTEIARDSLKRIGAIRLCMREMANDLGS